MTYANKGELGLEDLPPPQSRWEHGWGGGGGIGGVVALGLWRNPLRAYVQFLSCNFHGDQGDLNASEEAGGGGLGKVL